MILDTLVRSAQARADLLPPFHGQLPEKTGTMSLASAIASRGGRNAVIAEIKFASPSRGRISPFEDPCRIAEEYMAGGCIALSVLTEPVFFGGSTDTLTRVSRMSTVPVLRKDFIVDERQLLETRKIGADAVLLIAGVLGERLPDFVSIARALGIEPLVEVHTVDEADLALLTDATLIGINNRDLATMKVDLATTRRIAPGIRKRGKVAISESGVRGPEDIRNLRGSCDAFLIGSAIMSSANRVKFVEELVYA